MNILAIDPGNTQSGWVVLDPVNRCILEFGIDKNEAMLDVLTDGRGMCEIAIEVMKPRGMAMSIESMETLIWVGRFIQVREERILPQYRQPMHRVDRQDVKLHVCGQARAKDSNIRQALIDLYGSVGTKRNPGPTFGVTSHVWAALAVATTFAGIR